MRSMMERMVSDARERDESLASLWAAEGTIYRGRGYGIASRMVTIEADASMGLIGSAQAPVTPRLVDPAACHAAVGGVYDRMRAITPGAFRRSDLWMDVFRLTDPGKERDGRGPLYCVVIDVGGSDEAYALYRVTQKWPDGVPDFTLWINDAGWTSPDGLRELWRYLSSIDLVTRIEWDYPGPPVNHPLEWMVDEPLRLHQKIGEGMYMRLIDVAAALAARGYEDDGAIVFDLDDPSLPENSGRWRLAGGVAERSDAPAELQLSAPELGTVYLGDTRPTTLVAAGLITELVPGAAARADRIFGSTVTPWCPQVF